MANEAPNIVVAALSVECTLPESELRHYITDEELGALGEMKRDHISEIFWGALGMTLGAIVPSIDAVSRFNASNDPMGRLDLVVCFLGVMALAVTALTGYLWYERSKGRRDLLAQIRGRPKVKVVPQGS